MKLSFWIVILFMNVWAMFVSIDLLEFTTLTLNAVSTVVCAWQVVTLAVEAILGDA